MERNKNQKYQQLISTARTLFIQFGLKRVTVEEICKTAGVSKMTFYKFFRNKTDIVKEVYNELVNEGWQKYYKIMKKEIPFSEKLKLTLEMKRDMRKRIGNVFLQDLMDSEEYLPLIQDRIIEARDENIKFFNIGEKSGEFRKDIKEDFYLYLLDHLMVHMEDENLKNIFPDIDERLNELTKFFFYGMSDKTKEK